METSTVDTVINGVGFVAGFLVAAALLPQIYRAHKRKSAEDLSFFWQGTLVSGLICLLIYLEHYELWSVFIPLLAELVFILYLTFLKVYFNVIGPLGSKTEGSSRMKKKGEEMDHGSSNGSRDERTDGPDV